MKKYKWTLILSSLVTLIPVAIGLILWKRLPDTMPVHWGVSGNADAVAGPWFIVFLLPLILLALQWLCVWITFRDPKTKNQNPKAMMLALWVVPITSLFSTGIIYGSVFGDGLNLFRLVPLFLGALFLIIGNYMPKITQNSYLGIKNIWTLYSEENWNATHRFCGKTWVICGLIALIGVFLPEKFILFTMLVPLLGLVLSSTLYSYLYYRKQVRNGLPPVRKKPLTKKRVLGILAICVVVLLLIALLVYLMFTGDIRIRYGESALTVEADFYSDLTVEYAAITSVEHIRNPDPGMRVVGFASGHLLMGTFKNEEYGKFTLYAYTGCDSAVLIRSADQILLIGGESPDATQEIYESIRERIK